MINQSVSIHSNITLNGCCPC